MTQASIVSERPAPLPATSSHAARPVRASERLWDIRWPTTHFGDVQMVTGTFADAAAFIKDHFASIFPAEPNRFFEEKLTPAKVRFYEDSDTFLFRKHGRVVGIVIGNPIDWSTYYVRTMAVLPEARGNGILLDFETFLTDALRAVGVDRVEAETAPSNIPMNLGLVQRGWMVTASVNSDRWGLLLRYTKFLTAESERCFRQQFLAVPTLGQVRS